jgi:hypothetical protein
MFFDLSKELREQVMLAELDYYCVLNGNQFPMWQEVYYVLWARYIDV